MKKYAFLILVTLFFQIQSAHAQSCKVDEYQAIGTYQIVFKGKALDTKTSLLNTWFSSFLTGPDSKTTFRILKAYKGTVVENTLDVQHYASSQTQQNVNFEKDIEYLVFVNPDKAGTYILDPCSPTDKASNATAYAAISNFENNINLLQKYETLISAAYNKDKAELEELYKRYPNPDVADRLKKQYENKSDCTGPFSADENTPYFLKEFPSPIPENNYMDRRDKFFEYGEALYNLGRYKEALRPLCLAYPVKAQAVLLKTMAAAKLGLYQKDPYKFLDVSKLRKDNIRLDNLDLGSLDFNRSVINGFSMNKANLSGSNFSETDLKNVTVANAELINADFTASSVSGDFHDSNLTGSTLKNADFQNTVLNNVILKEADLRGANLNLQDLKKLDGIQLTDATFNQNTSWPAGFLPSSKGAVLAGDEPLASDLPVNDEMFTGLVSEREKLQLDKEGIYLIDGVHIKDYRQVYAENSKPNLLKVYSMTLMGQTYKHDIGRNPDGPKQDAYKELRVQGDVGLDIVLLDGCVEWDLSESTVGASYRPPNSDKYVPVTLYKYKAAASSGKQIEILIQKGLGISFSKDCSAPTSEKIAQNSESKMGPVVPSNLPLTESKKKVLDLLMQKALYLEKYWALAHPPNSINSPTAPEGTEECPAGEAIFRESGFYDVSIPEGCRSLYVKAWGAGGGGSSGGPGGFTMGIVDIPEHANIDVIVGGGGKKGQGAKAGLGGFNGGGDGGEGFATNQAFIGGGGGGGRTELLINNTPVLIAGGGGGSSRGRGAFPGGGRNPEDIQEAYEQREKAGFSTKKAQGIAGGNGVGGKAGVGYEAQTKGCTHATDGNEKNGGHGAIAEPGCEAAGGAGGGGGFGGGGGGGHDSPGFGGGGGGLAPEYGITVWGRANGHLPANVDDLYYNGLSGRAGQDGLIAVIWPAPDKEAFLRTIVEHISDETPFAKSKDKNKARDKIQKRIQNIENNIFKSQGNCKYNATVSLGQFVSNEGEVSNGMLVCLEDSPPSDYAPMDASNISLYERWRSKNEAPAYKAIIRLMKEGKFPTEFLSLGKEYGIGEDGYVLKQLDPSSFHGYETIDEKSKVSSLKEINTIFLESGWGIHRIHKPCNSLDASKSLYAPRSPDYFGGVGMGIQTKGDKVLLTRILSNTPADKAGLKEGDFILSIDGQNVGGLTVREIVKKLMGPIGTSVKIAYEKKDGKELKQEVSLTREYVEVVNPKSPNSLLKINYTPPYSYADFIVFGSGIDPDDMSWKDQNKLVNTKTGDTIEFLNQACFNLIFTEEGKLPEKPPSLTKESNPDFDRLLKPHIAEKPLIKKTGDFTALPQYPSKIRTALVRVLVQGHAVDNLYFDEPDSIKEQSDMSNYVFYPTGRGAVYLKAPSAFMANDKEGSWVFSSGWEIDKVATSGEGSVGNDIIAFLPHIKLNACKELNNQLGIKLQSNDDADSDGVPRGGSSNVTPTSTNGMTSTNPGISRQTDVIDSSAFVGRPFGCYDLSDGNGTAGDGPYVYYHVLIER